MGNRIDMSERKTAFITGANSGIGLATAQQLAAQGWRLLLLCRTTAKADAAAAEIRKTAPQAEVWGYGADLGDFAAVRAAAAQALQDHPVIDVLLNNAGYYPDKIVHVDGVEGTLHASHLGHFLLTRLLMPALERSPEARIVNVSSTIHSMGQVERMFKQVPGHSALQAYGDAKLANILFTMGLVRRLPAHITSYSLHPGVVNTGFGHNTGGMMGWMVRIFGGLLMRPSKGASTSVHLATAPIESLRPHNGRYFDKCKPVATRNNGLTEANAEWLWKESEGRV